jgi:hypothetical protein
MLSSALQDEASRPSLTLARSQLVEAQMVATRGPGGVSAGGGPGATTTATCMPAPCRMAGGGGQLPASVQPLTVTRNHMAVTGSHGAEARPSDQSSAFDW